MVAVTLILLVFLLVAVHYEFIVVKGHKPSDDDCLFDEPSPTDTIGGITWDQLGDKPMYGDMSDQGAVDIAIKIKDLEEFEAQAQTRSRRLYYTQKIKAQYQKLVEITLLQVAPPPNSPEPTLIPDIADKLIDFEEYRLRKKRDPG